MNELREYKINIYINRNNTDLTTIMLKMEKVKVNADDDGVLFIILILEN